MNTGILCCFKCARNSSAHSAINILVVPPENSTFVNILQHLDFLSGSMAEVIWKHILMIYAETLAWICYLLLNPFTVHGEEEDDLPRCPRPAGRWGPF